MVPTAHPTRPGERLQLKLELQDIQPTVWRRLAVPRSVQLPQLHRIIQITMGWEDRHQHEFDFAGRRYGTPDPEWPKNALALEKDVTLHKALGRSTSFTYVYDFGDDWRHLITVEEILPIEATSQKAECFAAENACPPEDIGGLPGYMNYLEAILDPTHLEHRTMHNWGSNKRFDPRFVNIDAINRKLAGFRI